MFLNHLALSNFKNCKEASLVLSPKINCFTGRNGAGKTNLLDAIYYLSFCKSYFIQSDVLNIRYGEDYFAINGSYSLDDGKIDKIQCIQRRDHPKKFSLNKKEYDRLADHIGLYPLVIVSPSDADLINDGSEIRRRYIDSVISQFDKTYLYHLINYNKGIAQRNAQLKQFAETHFYDDTMLSLWDERLIEPATYIFEKRRAFLSEFAEVFQSFYEWISESREIVSATYSSRMVESSFLDLQKANRDKDRILKYTSSGVHKDDLDLKMNGYPVKRNGSQGQQKSFVIALKLAQFEYTRRIKNFKPILLFDDIFDKLDHHRVDKLIKLVSLDSFGQVFITDTQPERINAIFKESDLDHSVFVVEDGQVEMISNP